jgi:CHAT domain-containing protein
LEDLPHEGPGGGGGGHKDGCQDIYGNLTANLNAISSLRISMYIIHSLRSPEYNKSYQKTGIQDPKQPNTKQRLDLANVVKNERQIQASSDIVGYIFWHLSGRQLKIIQSLCQLDASKKNESRMMEKLLNELKRSSRKGDSLISEAFIITFRLKFLFFSFYSGVRKLSSKEETEIKKLIDEGYDIYIKIFDHYMSNPIPEIDLFARIVNGFTHFCQVYLQLISPTSKNLKYINRLLDIVLLCELRYLPLIPPENIGYYYSVPKMIREIALASYGVFSPIDESRELMRTIDPIMAASYEYLTCCRCFDERRELANLLLQGRQSITDSIVNRDPNFIDNKFLNLPESMQTRIFDEWYCNLLIDTSRLLIINKFGTETNNNPYNNAIHLKFIILNEVLEGLMVIVKYRDYILIDNLNYNLDKIAEINNMVYELFESLKNDDINNLKIAELINQLFPKKVIEFIDSILERESPEYILVYPDGTLWHIPWPYFIFQLTALFPSKVNLGKLGNLPVILKIGFSKCYSNMNAKSFVGLAGWRYQNKSDVEHPKRGHKIKNFPNIDQVKEEVRCLGEMLKTTLNVDIDDDIDANDIVKRMQYLKKYSIVHIACHGSVEAGLPVLWLPGKNNDNALSGLHFEAIIRTSWSNCEFLFLNACFGSFGEPRVGGPIQGLHESFVLHSIPNFLGPLWPISDEIAKTFSNEFYKNLLESRDYFVSYHKSWKNLINIYPENQRSNIIGYVFYSL